MPELPSLSPDLQNLSAREDAQRRILEAALAVFSAKGFDGSSVREIASRCGVTHAMIKYYFKNKETLWREAVTYLFERATNELANKIDLNKAATSITEALREICMAMIGYFSQHPEHCQVVMQESMSPGARLDWIAMQSKQHHEGLWALLKESGLKAELDHPRFIAFIYMVTSMCQTPFALSHESEAIYDRGLTDPEIIATYTDMIVGLVPALASILNPDEASRFSTLNQLGVLPLGVSVSSSESEKGHRITIDLPAH